MFAASRNASPACTGETAPTQAPTQVRLRPHKRPHRSGYGVFMFLMKITTVFIMFHADFVNADVFLS